MAQLIKLYGERNTKTNDLSRLLALSFHERWREKLFGRFGDEQIS